MFGEFIDKIGGWIVYIGLPVVSAYHLIISSAFLNTSVEDATGLEKWGNTALIPFQYLFVGNVAHYDESDSYQLRQRFDYEDGALWIKTLGACLTMPSSMAYGILFKGLSYLSPKTKKHHQGVLCAIKSSRIRSNREYYTSLGIELGDFRLAELISSPTYARRPGDEKKFLLEREALKDIIQILLEEQIPFWADCGTCLGAYRYGGVIPWDNDIDIAILQTDFGNVKHALNRLDSTKYIVQDWSGRDKPNTYLKVYVKKTHALIDIYHCAIDEEKKEIYTILSNENSVFLPKSWKIRERRYTHPVPYSVIFPLKKAMLDGIEVPVPNETKTYLQSKYGMNIEPAKIYNEKTGKYEKDLSHPYWQLKYVH